MALCRVFIIFHGYGLTCGIFTLYCMQRSRQSADVFRLNIVLSMGFSLAVSCVGGISFVTWYWHEVIDVWSMREKIVTLYSVLYYTWSQVVLIWLLA